MNSHTWGKNESIALAQSWVKNKIHSPMPEVFFPLVHAVARHLMETEEYRHAYTLLEAERSMHVDLFPTQHAEHAILLIRACIANGKWNKAISLLEYYITHFYLFNTSNTLSPFIFMAASYAIEKKEKNLLSLCLPFLVYTQAGIQSSNLKRIIHRAGGLKPLLHLAGKLDYSIYLRLRFFSISERMTSLGILGILLTKTIHLGMVYFVKRSCNDVSMLLPTAFHREKVNRDKCPIVVTRAMGGIGDLLMMTPGLHALHLKYPNKKIILAISKKFIPIFETNDDVIACDINNLKLYKENCSALYNLTNCPATIIESATLPNVSQNRIDIFSAAMGISHSELDKSGRNPRYIISEEEKKWADNFFTEKGLNNLSCICIQPYAADTYKNYPYMNNLIIELSKKYTVLIFHNKHTCFSKYNNVIDLSDNTLRQNIALLCKVKFIIAIDSALVHISAAVGAKAFCLYGPTDGKIFTAYYKNCTVINAYDRVQCKACWRNKYIPCSKSCTNISQCLSEIRIEDIINLCQ